MGSRVTQETNFWACLWGIFQRVQWGGKTHPKCRWHNSMGWVPGRDKKERVEYQNSSLPFSIFPWLGHNEMSHVTLTLPCLPSHPGLYLHTMSPNRLFFVGNFVTTTGMVIVFLSKTQQLQLCGWLPGFFVPSHWFGVLIYAISCCFIYMAWE